MPRHEAAGGARAWAGRWWRALVAELCATALLVWLGVGSCVRVGDEPVPLARVAQAFGCVVVGCVTAFGPASGAHMNPAVSLAAALSGRLAAAPALAYALAQLAGGALGFAALLATLPATAAATVSRPGPGVGPLAAAGVEAALVALLVLACCAVWAQPAPDAAAPVKLGLLVAGLVHAGGAASGASLNPARSFAPALLYGDWEHQWVYWAGPLGGATLAALLHRWVLTAPAREERPAPETLPLDDKP